MFILHFFPKYPVSAEADSNRSRPLSQFKLFRSLNYSKVGYAVRMGHRPLEHCKHHHQWSAQFWNWFKRSLSAESSCFSRWTILKRHLTTFRRQRKLSRVNIQVSLRFNRINLRGRRSQDRQIDSTNWYGELFHFRINLWKCPSS